MAAPTCSLPERSSPPRRPRHGVWVSDTDDHELPIDAGDFVAARIAEGSDYIKIVYDDGETVRPCDKTIDELTLAAVIRATKASQEAGGGACASPRVRATGYRTRCRRAGPPVRRQPVDDAFVRLAAERKVFVIPTLTVLESVNREGGGASLARDAALAPFLMPEDARVAQILVSGQRLHRPRCERSLPRRSSG